MWAVFPIQDLLGMDAGLRMQHAPDERINQPGNPNHYWRYRMHLNLEDLAEQENFNLMLKGLIGDAGRLDIY
ncbi:MAG TPA: 4-alpha-glucanotransferase, partial [Bacteroidales bacterium]|nr:4-alpha-glucanotransferase [Bacteroidales bacterium]